MRLRFPYVAVSIGLALGLVSFLVGLRFFQTPQPLPPQVIAEPAPTMAASSRAGPTTTLGALPDLLADPIDERSLPSAIRPLDAGCDDPSVVIPPASDLPVVVAAADPGTCFVLEAGEYRFHDVKPKDSMTFLGVSRQAVVVVGSGETENAFHGTATGVTIGRMTLIGFQGDGGEKRQEQGAIRGTSALWESNRGQMALDWLIEDVEASDNFATGVFLGDRFTIRGSTFSRNGISGLGGSETAGGLIEGNVVSGNGMQQATGVLSNGGGMKFTQTISAEDPLVVRGNEIFGNSGIGVWCDIGCNGFEVINNYIHDQESRAIMFELSNNAVIRGNLLVNTNGWSDFSRDFNAAAIVVGESSDVIVEDNYIDGAVSGIIVRQTLRPVRPQESFLDEYPDVTYLSQRVSIRDNVIVNAQAMGISTGSTGGGLIPDLSSIRFERNIYSNPEKIRFWWENGDRYNFQEWQASGRDLGTDGVVPARPVWSWTS